MSLDKLIKIYGCHISNRTSAALVKHLDGGSFSFDEFSNSSFLLAAQLLKPFLNFLQWRSARRSFSLLFARRPLEARMLKWYGGVSSSLGLQTWKSPFGDICSFSVAFTTPRTAKYINGRRQFLSSVSLDRWLLEPDKLFRTARNDFLNLLDSKEFAAFLRMGKHFEKVIRSQVFDEKRVCKVGKPCLFASYAWESRASVARTF